MPGLKSGIASERVWTLVDVQVRSDAVPGSMTIVHAVLPQSLSGEDVQLVAAGTLGEDRAVDGNVSLEHPGICLGLFGSGAAKDPSSSGIASSVLILSSGVVEIWCVTVDHGGGGLGG